MGYMNISSYDLCFEHVDVGWSFERELELHEPIPGIKIVTGSIEDSILRPVRWKNL